MLQKKTFFNWSTGKDAALALYLLQQDSSYDVARLLTSVNAHHDRVSMHGVRRELLEQQVKSIGLPCSMIELPEQPDMAFYEKQMKCQLEQLRSDGFTHSAFGDIFLEDLRAYREKKLRELNIEALFPLWRRNTKELAHEFVDFGFKAIVVCVDAQLMNASFVGRVFDKEFINDLPPGVDPCGENGEFHTFCYDGPIFSNPIEFTIGEKLYREYKSPQQDGKQTSSQTTGFWFCDLLPANDKQ